MLAKQRLSKEEAIKKIKHYCAYQERCHNEVKGKLYGYGLRTVEVNEVIANMIENNYLNEERFAAQFAGGKFRMKQWGRKKIQYELQQKGVSSYIIKHALREIEQEEYVKILHKLASQKWSSLKGQQFFSKMAKTTAYLLQKGYEASLISEALKTISGKEKTK